MKKKFLVFCSLFFVANMAIAETDLACPAEILNKKELTVFKKGEAFNYPLPNETIIECYAKRLDGSIDEYEEYNDYFVYRDGNMYSNTTHKMYKPNKANELKKVDNTRMLHDGKTLKMYDPLWEWSFRHHVRVVKINTKTGEYFMNGTQDNWMWYRNITTSGYCRIMPKK